MRLKRFYKLALTSDSSLGMIVFLVLKQSPSLTLCNGFYIYTT